MFLEKGVHPTNDQLWKAESLGATLNRQQGAQTEYIPDNGDEDNPRPGQYGLILHHFPRMRGKV